MNLFLTHRFPGFQIWLAAGFLTLAAGCGSSAPMLPALESPPPAVVSRPGTPDQAMLEQALRGRTLPAVQVAELSDRLLSNSTSLDEETMARLELLLLKTLKTDDKKVLPALWRDLGIIHYHQKKYKQARQELQISNELSPRVARTHFYMARLYARQGQILDRQGKKKESQQQFKRATIEMGQARKIEPHNSTYRQDPKQMAD